MDDVFKNLTISQIASLIKGKRSEIDELSEKISINKLELYCLETLQRKVADIHPNEIWSEFLEFIEKKAPELAVVLKRAELCSLLPGKLLLKCADIDSEILFYQKSEVERYLQIHFDLAFSVSIVNEDGSS